MRLRNVKNKEAIINACDFIELTPNNNKGRWQQLFSNNNPIYIEIGMGKGNFIIENAKQNPNINYIGIEKYDSVICKAIEKVTDKLDNLRLIRMDARLITDVFDHEVSRIYLNFSDPWPKARHHIRRLSSEVFLERYDQIFVDTKEIIQKTDNRDLFEYSIISYVNYGYKINKISLDLHNSNIENNIMTEYEEKFIKKNQTIYYAEVQK